MRHTPNLALVLAAAALQACTAAATDERAPSSEPPVAPQAAPLVAGPVPGPAVDGVIPSLGVSGQTAAAAIDAQGADAVHEGAFSNGRDLAAPPSVVVLTPAEPGASTPPGWLSNQPGFVSWRSQIAGTSPATTVAPLFNARLSDAADSLGPDLAKLNQEALTSALAPIQSFLPVTPNSPIWRLVHSAPVRARWLRSQWGRAPSTGTPTYLSPETKYTYADPKLFEELRQRGARTYCAAREAASRQSPSTVVMGEMVGFSLNLLGKKIDFGVLEPTIALAEPKAFAGSDGTQVFKVPFLTGVRLTPIRGLGLPSLPEVRSPLVLLTGDSEVATASEKRSIVVPGPMVCSPLLGCRPRGTSSIVQHSKEHATAVHVDGMATAEGGASATVTIPLYTMGVLHVDLTLEGQLYFGRVETSNERLLDGAPFGWPAPRERGVTFEAPFPGWKYDESPIRFVDATAYTAPTLGVQASKRVTGATSTAYGPAVGDGMLTRALQDDDRVVRTASGVSITASIVGGGGIETGPVRAKLSVGGGITGDVSVRHEFRDSVVSLAPEVDSVEFQPVFPITTLSVAPRTRAAADITNVFANLELAIKLGPFGTIELNQDLFRVDKIPLASWDSGRWPSRNQLRIGTGSGGTDASKNPQIAYAHWPTTGDLPSSVFESIPDGVDACLAAPKPVTTPNACPPRMDPSTPASAEVCVFSGALKKDIPISELLTTPGYGPEEFWAAACANPAAAVATHLGSLNGAQQACFTQLATFVCSPVSKTQTWGGRLGIARVLRLDDLAMTTALASVAQQCAAAYVDPASPDANALAKSVVSRLLQLGTCTASAQMLEGDALVSGPANPSSPPPISSAASPCGS